ncbi:MAG: hypothetical protein NC231_13620 [Bacillus sp. (in: Bacteria)]|nr:hypothetical protein [Bacillus sp. (in: firmicutes)]
MGKGAKHTFYHIGLGEYAYIDNDVVYIIGNIVNDDGFGVTSYDIATKECEVCDDFKVCDRDVWNYLQYGLNLIDGTLYSPVGLGVKFTNEAGERFNFEPSAFFDRGIFGLIGVGSDSNCAVLSYNLEKIADITSLQHEVEHGLKEDMKLKSVYAPPINEYTNYYINNFYFGGDKYLGCKNGEYRWINLTALSMSEPLPFPEGKYVTILDDTYCIYEDEYGLFLWNYNDGTEETILMYEN